MAETNIDVRLLTFSHVLSYLSSLNLVSTIEAFELEAPALFHDFRNHSRPTNAAGKTLEAVVEEHAQFLLREENKSNVEENQLDRVLDVPPSTTPATTCLAVLDSIHHSNILTVVPHTIPSDTFTGPSGTDTNTDHPKEMNVLVTSSTDKSIRVSTFPSGKLLTIISHSPSAVLCISFHPTHTLLMATSAMDGTLATVDLSTGETVQEWKSHSKYATRCGFSGCGGWLASSSYDRNVNIYKLNAPATATAAETDGTDEAAVLTGDPDLDALPTLKAPIAHPKYTLAHTTTFKGAVECIGFLPPDEKHPYPTLVVGTRDDHYLHYIGLTTSPTIPDSSDPTSSPVPFPHLLYNLNSANDTCISYTAMDLSPSPSGRHILVHTDSRAGKLVIARARSPGVVKTLYGLTVDGFGTYRCSWSVKGDYVYATGDGAAVGESQAGGEVGVWEVRSGKLVARLTGHGGVVKGVAVVPALAGEGGEGRVVTCGFDKTVRVWGAKE